MTQSSRSLPPAPLLAMNTLARTVRFVLLALMAGAWLALGLFFPRSLLLLNVWGIGVFVAVLLQARSRHSGPGARQFRRSRRSLKITLNRADDSPRWSYPILDYRWRPRGDDRMDFGGRLDITNSNVYLTTRYTYALLLGMPLALPSYLIPLTAVISVHLATGEEPDLAPSRLFRVAFRVRPSPTLLVRTTNGGVCRISFASSQEANECTAVLTRILNVPEEP